MFVFEEAKRSEVKIKLAVGGPTGSGKTMSSLVLAYGLVKEEHPDWTDAQIWRSIFVIDTENRSASLYRGAIVGNMQIGAFMAGNMSAPYTATAYIDAIHAAENAGAQVLIVDSMSHAWSGDGGALDKQSKIAARTGNSYTAWRDITPEQNQLMNTILQSKCHIISCFRAKQDYVQEKNDKGKTVVRKVGMGLIYRDNAEYEYTSVFMLDEQHVACTTKDRTNMFDGQYFVITPEVGTKIARWLKSDAATIATKPEPVAFEQPAPAPVNEAPAAPQTMTAPAPDPVPPAPPADDDPFNTPDIPEMSNPATTTVTMEQLDTTIRAYMADKTPDQRRAIGDKVKEICGTKNYKTLTDPAMIQRLYNMFNK